MKFSIRSLILLGCVAISCQSSINCVPEKQDAFCLASNNGTKEELLKVFLDYTSIWVNFQISRLTLKRSLLLPDKPY